MIQYRNKSSRKESKKLVVLPDWLDPAPWLKNVHQATASRVHAAVDAEIPDIRDFAALISPAAGHCLESLAQKAQHLTCRHFGRTISLYIPLYLADFCSSGCVYCAFASDRSQPRRKLEPEDLKRELVALKAKGFDDILLLTGDRTGEAGFPFLKEAVGIAADTFHFVSVESFTMTEKEYHSLARAGCTSIILYQETYDPINYFPLHRWGPKFDYERRLHGPSTALEGGMRSVGLGVLLGLAEPVFDLLCLYRHASYIRKHYWKAGISVSFPRMQPQLGDYKPTYDITDAYLAQIIFAFRICFPDIPLVLSTRESPRFRDNMAGVGISKMSTSSRTTVGGYVQSDASATGQFEISDERDVGSFCDVLRGRNLEPVFKNWESIYREPMNAE